MFENVEAFLIVNIPVGKVAANGLLAKVFDGCHGEVIGKEIGFRLAFAGVDAPSSGLGPFAAVSEGVGMYGDQDYIFLSQCLGVGVCALAPLGKWDIVVFLNEKLGVIAFVSEVSYDASCYFTVEFKFEKSPVWRSFAWRVLAMAIVN